jgi:hypothetical protein
MVARGKCVAKRARGPWIICKSKGALKGRKTRGPSTISLGPSGLKLHSTQPRGCASLAPNYLISAPFGRFLISTPSASKFGPFAAKPRSVIQGAALTAGPATGLEIWGDSAAYRDSCRIRAIFDRRKISLTSSGRDGLASEGARCRGRRGYPQTCRLHTLIRACGCGARLSLNSRWADSASLI